MYLRKGEALSTPTGFSLQLVLCTEAANKKLKTKPANPRERGSPDLNGYYFMRLKYPFSAIKLKDK